MRYSLFSSTVAVLAVCSNAAFGALTATQIAENINTLTSKSKDLQEPANSLNTVNGPLLAVGQGPFPQIITGLHNIVTTATEDVRQMKDSQALTETTDQDTVYDAFRDFASAHSELLNILIGKSGLFSTVPFIGQPLVAVLRSDEDAIDSLTYSLVDLIQSRAADIESVGQTLSASVTATEDSYSGL
ncbi:UVI-1 protein [Pestalotiopsis sp. NC0098]|nr:UVI-1 protein [Pestalotiopsis sp. NC0098]